MSYRPRDRSRSRSWDRRPRRSRSPGERRHSPDRRRDSDRYGRSGGSHHNRGISNPPTDHPDANPGNNLYVNGIPRDTTEAELEALFAPHGTVTSCNIITDPITKVSRGFGFVSLETAEEADKAISAIDGSLIQEQVVKVEKSRRKGGHRSTPGTYFGPNSGRERDRGGDRERGGDYRRRRSPSNEYKYNRRY